MFLWNFQDDQDICLTDPFHELFQQSGVHHTLGGNLVERWILSLFQLVINDCIPKKHIITRWWIHFFYIFTSTWANDPIGRAYYIPDRT